MSEVLVLSSKLSEKGIKVEENGVFYTPDGEKIDINRLAANLATVREEISETLRKVWQRPEAKEVRKALSKIAEYTIAPEYEEIMREVADRLRDAAVNSGWQAFLKVIWKRAKRISRVG